MLLNQQQSTQSLNKCLIKPLQHCSLVKNENAMKKRFVLNFSPSSWLLPWTQYDMLLEKVWLLHNSSFTSFHCRGFYPSSHCSTCCCWVCLGRSSAPLWNFLQTFRSKQNTLVNGGKNMSGCLTTGNNKSHNYAKPTKLRLRRAGEKQNLYAVPQNK